MYRSESYESQGRKIDEWFYTYTSLEPKDGQTSQRTTSPLMSVRRKITLEVRLEKTLNRDGPPLSIAKSSFSVACRDPAFTFHGTDIEALRQCAFAELDALFTVKWESFLVVRVERERHYGRSGSGFAITWEEVERGTTKDGLQLRRDGGSYRGKDIKAWPERFEEEGSQCAVLPDTRENRESLQNVEAMLANLRKILARSMSPENIAQVLSGTALPPFLLTARTRTRDAAK